MDEQKYSWLFYGKAGVGKSFMLASALVDYATEEKKRSGIILDFEARLEHLKVPAYMVKDLRPQFGRPDKLVGTVEKWMTALFRDLATNKPGPEVIGYDSLTEAQFLLRLGMAQEAHDENPKEDEDVLSQRGWGKILDRMALNIGYLRPRYTKAHFLATAHVEEKRGPMNSDDIQMCPRVQGALSERVDHYFDFVVFVEKRTVKVEGERQSVHRYHFDTNGDFLTKNILELEEVLPPYLDNPTFDTILDLIGKKKGVKEVGDS